MTADEIEIERKAFEAIISGPPFEKSINRFPADAEGYAWPDAYRDIETALAWQAWLARARQAAAAKQEPAPEDAAEAVRLAIWLKRSARSRERLNGVTSSGPDSNVKPFNDAAALLLRLSVKGE